jgi:hypothetical protein
MRNIVYDPAFTAAVERLGGYILVDDALDPILDGLSLNPYGFPLIENDWVRIRYVITKPTGYLPSLVVMFTIETNGDVTLRHVEEFLEE